jgi:hypothetical protein
MNASLLPHSQTLDAIIIISYSFWIFFNFKNTFKKTKLHILIELEILYHPVYLSIFLQRFIEKKIEYSEHIVN